MFENFILSFLLFSSQNHLLYFYIQHVQTIHFFQTQFTIEIELAFQFFFSLIFHTYFHIFY